MTEINDDSVIRLNEINGETDEIRRVLLIKQYPKMLKVEYHFIGDIVKIVHKIRRSAPNKIEKIKWDIIHKFIVSENTDKPVITSTVATH